MIDFIFVVQLAHKDTQINYIFREEQRDNDTFEINEMTYNKIKRDLKSFYKSIIESTFFYN